MVAYGPLRYHSPKAHRIFAVHDWYLLNPWNIPVLTELLVHSFPSLCPDSPLSPSSHRPRETYPLGTWVRRGRYRSTEGRRGVHYLYIPLDQYLCQGLFHPGWSIQSWVSLKTSKFVEKFEESRESKMCLSQRQSPSLHHHHHIIKV